MTRPSSSKALDGFPDSSKDISEARPFYWLLLFVLAAFYVSGVYSTPALREPIKLPLFTALMATHGALHWVSPQLAFHRRWFAAYYVTQGLLALAITLFAPIQGLSLGLFLALAGEVVGILEDLRKSLLPVAGYIGLAALSYGLTWGWDSIAWWGTVMAPMAFFVVIYVWMFVRQANARDQAQKLLRELEVAHQQLADYAARVEELTLANERQRMARELHDTLAQGLAGLILQLEAANSHLNEQRTERAQAILQQAMGRARATLADARRAIDDLREGRIYQRDFEQTLREEVSRFTSATGIPCDFEIAPALELSDSIGEHIVRVASEALTNIARHAQAQHASVRVASEGGFLSITICDDGRGFDASAPQSGHYGLVGIQERARLTGGTCQVDSTPGKGTQLVLRIPLGITGAEA